MRFVSWNIRGNTGVGTKRMPRIVDTILRCAPDVLVLQEVPNGEARETLVDALATAELTHVIPGVEQTGYSNLVASRWPTEALEPGWFLGPRPSSTTGCAVQGPMGDFVAICAHMPNGSGNGWVKIETFESLAAAIHRIELPIVLGGDFNEPRKILDDGTVISFAMKKDTNGAWHMRGSFTGKCGRRFPRARWARGVRSILGREPSVNLRHVLRTASGVVANHTTHVVRGRERFFDHILVSPQFEVVTCGFDDDCRSDKTSDHSAVWADISLE